MPKKAVMVIVVAIILLAGGAFAYKTWQGRQLAQQSVQNQPATQDETVNWKTYKNDKYGLSFEYPKDWLLNDREVSDENGAEIVSLISPEGERGLEEDSKKEFFEGGYYYKDFAVSYCKSINTECTTGGSWIGERVYNGIEDLLSDENSFKQRSNFMPSVDIGGLKGYGVISSGFYANYEIMVEHNGIFLLDLPNVDTDTALSQKQQHILSSFRFTR